MGHEDRDGTWGEGRAATVHKENPRLPAVGSPGGGGLGGDGAGGGNAGDCGLLLPVQRQGRRGDRYGARAVLDFSRPEFEEPVSTGLEPVKG